MRNPAPILLALSLATLSGCAIQPKPLEQTLLKTTNDSDRQAAFAGQTPLGSSLTLNEAIARALKYNLDQRTRLLEQSLAASQLQAGQFDMLPKLLANAGYSSRDNDNVRFSADPSQPGSFSNSTPFLSSERNFMTYDLTLSWNLLDFGASYYTAKQNADRLLIASERRRKAMHTLIQNVRTAYWRALAAESLGNRVRETIVDAERALANSRKVTEERVKAPVEALRYQRNLLENLRLVESVERELASARIDLANLIGTTPGIDVRLIEPSGSEPAPLSGNIERFEEMALVRNADLRESFYNARIAANDTRKALLRLLPGISFDYGAKYNDDRFLLNDRWNEAGVRVSTNLFNLLSGPIQMRSAEKNEQVAQAKRMALQMTVLTQVHLVRYQYDDALRQYRRSEAIFKVDNELSEVVAGQQQGQMTGELERIAASVTAILSNVRRYQSMAKVQEATARVQSTLGLEPELPAVDSASLEEVQQAIDGWMARGIDVGEPEVAPEGAPRSADDAPPAGPESSREVLEEKAPTAPSAVVDAPQAS